MNEFDRHFFTTISVFAGATSDRISPPQLPSTVQPRSGSMP